MAAFNSTTLCNTCSCSCVHGSTGSLVKQPDIGSPKGRTRQPPRVDDDDDDDDGRPGDVKNAHLMSLDVAAERLRLFKADLLDYSSVAAAIAGCDDVFHVACPVHTLAAAVTGTTNVRKACSEARLGLGRVVVVSYVSAAMIDVAAQQESSSAAGPRSCSSGRRSFLSRRAHAGLPSPPDGWRPPHFSPPAPFSLSARSPAGEGARGRMKNGWEGEGKGRRHGGDREQGGPTNMWVHYFLD
uniref:3-beta hydroxysteroid dehydrogenase/isomerase domain-containing protein n=1 Tax=Oryza glumipatula TaxID=40148 RepID=A0A0D9ZEZ2_9ORYZ